jgi:C-terminal processing protease CtpA/Prc
VTIRSEEGQYVDVEPGKTHTLTLSASDVIVSTGRPFGERGGNASPGTIGASFENQGGAVTISFVVSNSPASEAGLTIGDEVIQVDGRPVENALAVYSMVNGKPGDIVNLSVRRQGQVTTVSVSR